MGPRGYEPNAARLLRRSTLVYSLADIRRNIQLRRADGAPCDLELADNVVVDGRIDIPASLASFSLDGAGRYELIVLGTLPALFTCAASPTTLSNLSIRLKAGAVVTTAFLVSGSPTILQNVDVDARNGTLTNIFDLPAAGAVGKLVVDVATFRSISHIFKAPNGTGTWSACRLSDITVSGVGAALVTLGQGATTPGFDFCRFERITGPLSINPGPLSIDTIFDSVEGDGTSSTIDTTNSANPHIFIDCRKFVTTTLTRADTVIGGRNNLTNGISRLTGLATASSVVTLSTAGPTITPSSTSFLRVTHAAGSSGNITIAAGIDGQRLTLFFVSYAGTAVYTTGAGNLRLAGSPFTPTAKDVLELIYDATTAEWVEVSRSINA